MAKTTAKKRASAETTAVGSEIDVESLESALDEPEAEPGEEYIELEPVAFVEETADESEDEHADYIGVTVETRFGSFHRGDYILLEDNKRTQALIRNGVVSVRAEEAE